MRVTLDNSVTSTRPLRRRDALAGELASFLAIGGMAALGFVLLSSAMLASGTGLPDWLVSAFCYGLFVGPVYLLHRRFSFSSDASHGHALPRYLGVQLGGLLLAAGFSYLAYTVAGLGAPYGAGLVIALTSGVNFVILKLWAFAGGR